MNILKWPSKIILLSIILVNCGESVDSRDINCIGTSGNTLRCSTGSCSKVGGVGCSAKVDGVACCNTTITNDGTNKCSLGYCWTRENICCARSTPYPCKGYCYATNVCNYTSLTTACHDW